MIRVIRRGVYAGAGIVVLAAAAGAGGSAAAVTIAPALLAEARARGTARSIVEMRVPAGATDAEIESVKRRVLARIARTKHQVLRELTGLPMLVLEASAATLQALAASPDVLRVNADAVDAPQ